jgi:hypothetical protein
MARLLVNVKIGALTNLPEYLFDFSYDAFTCTSD